MQGLVSVVVPVYGVEDLLGRCVDSILSQTYSNLEVILVDDGSPDACGEICDSYAKADPRVKVVHQENAGLSAARNAGLGIARGEYVTFVDSDDWIHRHMIQGLRSMIRSGSLEIAVCSFVKTFSDVDSRQTIDATFRALSNREALQALAGADQAKMVIACAKLFPKALLEDFSFPVGRYHEDEFTTFQLLWCAEKVVVTDAAWYYYWQRPGSITGSYSPRERRDARDGLRVRASFLLSVDLKREATAAYRKALMIWMNDRVWRHAVIDLEAHREELRDFVRELGVSKQPLWLRCMGRAWITPWADAILASLWRWIHAIRHRGRVLS